MRRYVIRHDRDPGRKFHRSYHLSFRLPPPLDCEVLGHKPVLCKPPVLRHGWVQCARCFRRPLHPVVKPYGYDRGSALLGQFGTLDEYARYANSGQQVVWSDRTATLRAEVVRGMVGLGLHADVSIGTSGSETPLDASLTVPGVGGVFLGVSGLGDRLVHRRGERETVETGFALDAEALRWSIAMPKDSARDDDPRWRRGYVVWQEALFGRPRSVRLGGEWIETSVTLPEGTYPVRVRREVLTYTWPRLRRRKHHHRADIEIPGGIPLGRVRHGRQDTITGYGTAIDQHDDDPVLVATAQAALVSMVLRERAIYTGSSDWTPPAAPQAADKATS